MARILILCPTHRDRRELPVVDTDRRHEFLFHPYASGELEQMVSSHPLVPELRDVEHEIEGILKAVQASGIEGVASTDDYPGTAVASVICEALGLPGTPPRANLLCQHKYQARLVQSRAAPEVVPRFALLRDQILPAELGFPVFLKPLKSFFSVGACRADDASSLRKALACATLPEPFYTPLCKLFERHTGLPFGDGRVIAESLVRGRQATLEGFARGGQYQFIGVTDAAMFPGTLSFRRFEYPSSLPQPVQERMGDAAATVLRALGFDHGLFNIEFMYDATTDSLYLIEINPRMASQFADLYEKVDGFNTYSVLLSLALGEQPVIRHRQGRHRLAVSHVLRRFRDARVVAVPSGANLETLQRRYPDVRFEVLAGVGRYLSQELQDGRSFRYGILNCGGRDAQDIGEIIEECMRQLPFGFVDQDLPRGSAET